VRPPRAGLMVGALGVVFGDIGTAAGTFGRSM
jgi:K+ transporter